MTASLEQWLARIERAHPAEMELGLGRIRPVAERLGLVPFPLPVITVAGTNGKGSTLALMEAMLIADGYRPALYTSPHIRRFNERLRLGGQEVADGAICAALEAVDAARGETSLTYFEFATLAALWHFRREAPDLCLLEVGLGGRLDAVNLVDADVGVITSIGLDHTDWLGEDRDSIAREKAGIMRPDRPLVYGEHDMPAVIGSLARDRNVPLWRAGEQFGAEEGGIFWQQEEREQRSWHDFVPLGDDNLATAVQALVLAGFPPGEASINQASSLRLPGRRDHRVVDGVDWYLDVGHNAEALSRFLSGVPAADRRSHGVVAMRVDKPARRALAYFESAVDHWYLAGLPGPRGGGPERIHDALGQGVRADRFERVGDALKAARQNAVPGDRVLVFGSFLTVAAALEWLEAPESA